MLLLTLLIPFLAHADDYKVEELQLKKQPVVMKVVEASGKEIPAITKATLAEIRGVLKAHKVKSTGKPFMMRIQDSGGGPQKIEVGVPVAKALKLPKGEIQASTLPAGKVAKTVHVGDYKNTFEGIKALREWLVMHDMESAGPTWIVNLDDTATTKPEERRAEIFVPVRKLRANSAAEPANQPHQ